MNSPPQAPSRVVATTCPYCGVGCGILAERDAQGRVSVRGDPNHPANRGRLCSKGTALPDTLASENRLLYPEIRGRRVAWDEALDHVAAELSRTIREHGPESIAFYVSGQLLTEDYYVANKLMKGYIGSANIDTNSRLCMASSVAGYKRAFGADLVPCSYEDLELADLLVLVGSNAAWCHPVLWQRMLESRQARPAVKIAVIDPRRTATAEEADLFLPLKPGTDAILFNGLLNHLKREDALDWAFIERSASGMAGAFAAAAASGGSIPSVAAACDLEEAAVATFYRWFARTARTVTIYSQGANQSAAGTDKVNSIINCHLATGRVGKPGMGPFSFTGQPNAMGGREVGGLANQLAAHMEIDNPAHRERVQRFWGSPVIAHKPGLKAVDLFKAIEQGQVRAVWIMATNPVVSLPDADRARRALRDCGLVIVSDCVRDTDTTALAHVLLPALTWGEKDGTVTNSERRISRQRAFLPAPGNARPDWWIITQVARRMGFAPAFAYESPADIFREHARLSAFENDGERVFDIGALATLSDTEYDALLPRQWPAPRSRPAPARVLGDGRFFTPDGKARLIAVEPRPPVHQPDAHFPLALNTGRMRDHWHTLTRTGAAARLSAHTPAPFLELNARDARRYDLADGAWLRVVSRWGEATLPLRVSDSVRSGAAYAPMHWNDQFASSARINAVVNPATDPVSGQPELKHTPVRIEPIAVAWHGLLLSRARPAAVFGEHWSRCAGNGHEQWRLAGSQAPENWSARAHDLLGAASGAEHREWIEFEDRAAGRYRAALLRDGRLETCLFIACSAAALPDTLWLGALFRDEPLSAKDRATLLTGRPARSARRAGAVVCACHGIGRGAIVEAISAGADSVDAIGASCKAGTECGSCRSELRALLCSARRAASARSAAQGESV